MADSVVQRLVNSVEFRTDKKSKDAAESGLQDVTKAALAAAAGFTAAGAAGFAMTKEFANTADGAIKAARNLGLTVEQLTALEHAADQNGVSQDRLRDGLKDLQKNSSDAARGNKEMAKTLNRLGISAHKFVKIPADEKLIQIADGLTKVNNPADRARIRMQVLGEAGAHMGTLLDNGADGIIKLREEAHMLGFVIDTETAVAAEKMNDELAKTTGVVKGLSRPLAKEFMPVITEVATETREFVGTLDKDELRGIGREIGGGVLNGFQKLLTVARFLRDNLQLVKAGLIVITSATIIANLGKMGTLFTTIAKAATVTNLNILLIAAALGVLYLAYDEFIAFLEGRPSLIADMIGDPDDVEMYRRAFEIFFQEIHDQMNGLGEKPFSDWFLEQMKEAHELGVEEMSGFFKETADDWVSWQSDFTFDEFKKNMKRDLKEIGLDFDKLGDGFLAIIERIRKEYEELVDGFKNSIDIVGNTAERVLSAPGRAARGIAADVRGLLTDEPTAAVVGAMGGGAANPSMDMMGSMARAQNLTTTRDVNVQSIEVVMPEGANLTQQQITDGVSEGVADAITAADLRRASRQVDGAMQ